jgi:transcriptional regulator GlxA family with amidase domain
MESIKSILVLAYPNAGEQDLLVPWELFKALAWDMAQRGEKLEVVLGSFDAGLVATQMGTKIQPEKHITPTDRFDLVYVPGGIGAGAQSKNETLLAFLRAHHAEGRWIAGNCAGMAVLHRAGVLAGSEVTTPATLARRLAAEGTRVASPRRAWKINPGQRIFSAGGAGTVHPSTIALVWHLFGDAAGRALAAGWDTLPLFGEALFSLVGPVMKDDQQVKNKLQDTWENVFLP